MATNVKKKTTKQIALTSKKVAGNGYEALKPAVAAGPDSPSTGAAVSAPPQNAPKVKVRFFLPFGDANHLSLSGDFNGWSTDATPMKRYDDGHWEATVFLAPGRYEYKYVRDGEWIPDPTAEQNVWNLHGTLNSVMEVRMDKA